jgi:hypothetical protein
MPHLTNKTLLTALAGAWLLAAAVFVLVPSAGSRGNQNRPAQTPLSTTGGNVAPATDPSGSGSE